MLPLLVLACLTGAPGHCEVREQGAWPDQASCQRAGREHVPAPGWTREAWTCGDGAFWVAEVAPGVYVHRGQVAEPGPGNGADTAKIGYVVGEEAVAVIDAGGSDAVARALLDDIRARTDLPVWYLVLTHMHPDHVMGAGVFLEAGATAIAHPAFAAGLAARYDHYHQAYARDVGPGWSAAEGPPPVSETPEAIDLGDRVLELRRHGVGHTTNDLSVFDRDTATWFLGDLAFLTHLPSIDGSVTGWQQALRAAADRPAARVVPGHGPVSAPWPDAAAPTLSYLSDLATGLRAEIAKGTALIDVVTGESDADLPGWLLSQTYHPRNITAAWRELEWE